MPDKKPAFFWIAAALLAVCGCGGGSLSPPPITTTRALASISPISAVVGSPDLTLDVRGSGFYSSNRFDRSIVVWAANGANTDLASTFISPTELSAVVPARLLQAPVTAQIFVQSGDPMGDVPLRISNSMTFTVLAPTPGGAVISAISPSSAAAGSPDLTLTITGSNFANLGISGTSIAFWGDTMLATTFVSSSQLTAVIPAALLQTPTSAEVFVLTGDPMGMSDGFLGYPRSNSVTFTVTP